MKYLIKYHYFNLKRFNISSLGILPPEYIGLFFSIITFSTIFFGVSSEKGLELNQIDYINFNKLSLFYLIAPILFEAFIYKFYDPNYKYVKLIFPYPFYKVILIDILIEIFSYKMIFIIAFPFLYIIFCYSYNMNVFDFHLSFYGILLIILTYINSCILISLFKNILINDNLSSYKNYIKACVFILFLIFLLNDNFKWIQLQLVSTIFQLIYISIVLLFIQFLVLIIFSFKFDKC